MGQDLENMVIQGLFRRNRTSRQRRRGGSVIGSLMLLAMGGFFLWFMMPLYEEGQASEDWLQTSGRIEHSEVDSHLRTGSDRGRIYSADIRYRYTVNDQSYQGVDVTLSDGSSSRVGRARGIVNDYPVGQNVTVYYDPELPERAVLEPGVSWMVYGFLLMGGLMVLLGIYVFWRTIVVAIALLVGVGTLAARLRRS